MRHHLPVVNSSISLHLMHFMQPAQIRPGCRSRLSVVRFANSCKSWIFTTCFVAVLFTHAKTRSIIGGHGKMWNRQLLLAHNSTVFSNHVFLIFQTQMARRTALGKSTSSLRRDGKTTVRSDILQTVGVKIREYPSVHLR